MTRRRVWIATVICILISALGMSAWLVEILEIKGWYGLNWLSGSLYSPYIANLLAAFAFTCPFFFLTDAKPSRLILSTLFFYLINLLFFYAGHLLCVALYCRFCMWKETTLVLMLLTPLVLYFLLGLMYWFTIHKLVKKNKKINLLLITVLALSAIPLSFLSIHLNSGFGSHTGWVDVVKMGYPIFWTTLALGLSGIIIAKQKSIEPTQTET